MRVSYENGLRVSSQGTRSQTSAQNGIELTPMRLHLAYSHLWAAKKPRVASAGNRYESAPVGHVLRVAEMTKPSKAAGAIVSSFSSHDKLLVMAKGAKAVYAAVKAISSARFMALRGNVEASFDIAMQPVLQPGPQSMSELHQIRIYLYKVPVSDFSLMIGSGGKEKRGKNRRTMKVGASTDPRGLAGAVTTTLLGAPGAECECLAAGCVPVYRAIRGVAIARHVMLKKNDPHPDQHDEEGSPPCDVSTEDRKPKGEEDRVDKARLWPFPHQKRQRARVSAEDYGPKDREALDLMAFVGWRDFEDGKQCIALVLKACAPGHLEGESGMGDEDEDDLIAPRA
jgi:stage V sporulation protein SpoVS